VSIVENLVRQCWGARTDDHCGVHGIQETVSERFRLREGDSERK
jgi:hypothetical protein